MVNALSSVARIAYGGLTALACVVSFFTAEARILPSLFMLCGGLLLLVSGVKKTKTTTVVLSLLVIHGVALWNGINGVFHWSHHAVRLCISVAILGLHLCSEKKNRSI